MTGPRFLTPYVVSFLLEDLDLHMSCRVCSMRGPGLLTPCRVCPMTLPGLLPPYIMSVIGQDLDF
jgi:hypothetical protein